MVIGSISLLLIHKTPSGVLVPQLWYAVGADAMTLFLNMLSFSAKRATEIYPTDTKVLIRRGSKEIRVFTQSLFEDFSGHNVYSVALDLLAEMDQ